MNPMGDVEKKKEAGSATKVTEEKWHIPSLSDWATKISIRGFIVPKKGRRRGG